MDEASPATSTSTARGNRGGRPRDWTDGRTRRLTRLYLYTPLQLPQILEVLNDGVWKPGKEAANKVLNGVFGKDPRWMRPKGFDESRKRMDGLKKSERAQRKKRSHPAAQPYPATQPQPDYVAAQVDLPPAAQVNDFHYDAAFLRTDTLDSKTLTRSSGSSFEKVDAFAHERMDSSAFKTQDIDFAHPPPPPPTSHAVMPDVRMGSFPNSSQSTFRFPPRGISRQGTTNTASTDFTMGSTREEFLTIQDKLRSMKLSDCSPSDVKDIFRLFKRFTISDEENSRRDLGYSPNFSAHVHRSGGGFREPQRQMTLPVPGVTVAGNLMDIESFLKPVLGSTTGPTLYVSDNQLYELPQLDLRAVDQYGNTSFHLLATDEGYQQMLLDAVRNDSGMQGLPIAAQNTAGQTFLHVLHPSWFDDGSPLDTLLASLRSLSFDFYAIDVYGQNFFHILRQNLEGDSPRMRETTRVFDINAINRRDAFGTKPMMLMKRTGTMPVVQEEKPIRITIPQRGEDEELQRHTQLLKQINDASRGMNPPDDPQQGRNALHALAEVKLIDHAQKRKMDKNDEPTPVALPLSRRLEFLETLLEAKVDVNHYNADGDTVLMAFVSHIVDGEADKDLEKIIKLLLDAGANMDARNRHGETALHVAVRHGQKFAIKVLLKFGANPHARDSDGLGVLQLCDRMVFMTEDDRKSNARLEACRAILTTERFVTEVVQNPTIQQEWSFRRS